MVVNDEADSLVSSRRRERLVIPLFAVIFFIDGCIFSSIAPFFPVMASGKGLSTTEIGIVLGSLPLSQLISYQVIGLFSASLNLKTALVTGMVLSTMRCLAMAFPASGRTLLFWSSLSFQVLEGIAGALACTAMLSLLVIRFPDRAAQLQPVLESFFYAGVVAGLPLTGFLFEAVGYKGPFLVTAGACLVAGVAAAVVVREEQEASSDGATDDAKGIGTLVRRPRLCMSLVIELWSNIIVGFVDGDLGLFLQKAGVRPVIVNIVFVTPVVLMIGTGVIFSRLMKGREKWTEACVCISFLVSLVAFLFYGPVLPVQQYLSPLACVVIAQVLLGLVTGFSHVSALIMATSDMEEMGVNQDPGFTTAFATSFLSAATLGLSLGPMIGGYLIHVVSHEIACSIFAGLQLVVITSVIVYSKLYNAISRSPDLAVE